MLTYLCLQIIHFAALLKCVFDLYNERQFLKSQLLRLVKNLAKKLKTKVLSSYVVRLVFVHILEILRLRCYVWELAKEPRSLCVLVQRHVITPTWSIFFIILKEPLLRFLDCYTQFYLLPYFGRLTFGGKRNRYNPEYNPERRNSNTPVEDGDEEVGNELNVCEDQFESRIHFYDDHSDFPPIKCPAVKFFASLRGGLDDVMADTIPHTTQNGTRKSVNSTTYTVVSGGTQTKELRTKIFASLPRHDKYLIRKRVKDSSGATRIKLVLKSSRERYGIVTHNYPNSVCYICNMGRRDLPDIYSQA